MHKPLHGEAAGSGPTDSSLGRASNMSWVVKKNPTHRYGVEVWFSKKNEASD